MTNRLPSASSVAKSAPKKTDKRYTDSSLFAHAALEDIRDSGAARLTIAICTAFLTFLIVWASQVQVEEKVTGTGTIEPKGRLERIEHPDGGVVRELMVQDNDILQAGGLLLRLDTDHIDRELQSISSRIATLQDESERVRFLLHTDGQTIPAERGAGDAASEAFWTEQMFLIAQLDRIILEDLRLVAQIESAETRNEISAAEYQIVEQQLERYNSFSTSGSVRLIDRERLEREALQLTGSMEEDDGRQAELKLARGENAQRREELLAQRRRDAAARWTKIEAELVALRQSAADAEARIERANVRTVNGGKLQRLEVSNPNEVIAPGDMIAEIVPPGTEYRAVINVSADRIGSIRQGMDVKLKVVSYDFTRFGAISAQISEVSPTSFLSDTGEIVYRVTVNLPTTVPTSHQPIAVRLGMTVSADILTGERTILSYLLHPVRRIQDQSLSER